MFVALIFIMNLGVFAGLLYSPTRLPNYHTISFAGNLSSKTCKTFKTFKEYNTFMTLPYK